MGLPTLFFHGIHSIPPNIARNNWFMGEIEALGRWPRNNTIFSSWLTWSAPVICQHIPSDDNDLSCLPKYNHANLTDPLSRSPSRISWNAIHGPGRSLPQLDHPTHQWHTLHLDHQSECDQPRAQSRTRQQQRAWGSHPAPGEGHVGTIHDMDGPVARIQATRPGHRRHRPPARQYVAHGGR